MKYDRRLPMYALFISTKKKLAKERRELKIGGIRCPLCQRSYVPHPQQLCKSCGRFHKEFHI